MSKSTSKPKGLPKNFDPILNLTYNVNRFYDFISKRYNSTEVHDALKGLYKLKNEKRQLQLISPKKYTDDAISGLVMFCEYLTHKDRGYTYIPGVRSRDGIYECYCRIFKDKKAPANIRQIAILRFLQNNITLNNAGFFDPFNKDEDYNYIFYFDKDGVISTREVPAMLDILFDCKLRDDVELILTL